MQLHTHTTQKSRYPFLFNVFKHELMWLKVRDKTMLSLVPYLVTPSGLTGDAGITAGHYLHIFCWYHYASGAVITRKAAFKKNKGEKKINQTRLIGREVRYLLFMNICASGMCELNNWEQKLLSVKSLPSPHATGLRASNTWFVQLKNLQPIWPEHRLIFG